MNTINLVTKMLLEPYQQGFADTVVLVDSKGCYTYADVYTRVKACAKLQFLKDKNKGECIACVLPDSLEGIVVFLALMSRGLVPCLLNVNLPDQTIDEYIDRSKSVAVIAESEFVSSYKLRHRTNKKFLLAVESVFSNRQHIDYTDDEFVVDTHHEAFALFSSGTTGSPLFVMHRHQDPLIMNEHYGKQVLNLSGEDVLFSTSKFYFAYGLNTLFFSMLNQAKLIIGPSEFVPTEIWLMLEKHKPTVFFSVPTMYKRLLNTKPRTFTLQNLRLCISAGENLPLPVFQAWQQAYGCFIIDGIGTTEILSTFISNQINKVKASSTGVLVPGFEAKLTKLESDEIVQQGEEGILWVRGNTYVDEYPYNKEESEKRFNNGWFKTNDIFSQDADGFFYYHGRTNDLIKVSGLWVYPYKIEQVLLEHSAVEEAAVVGELQSDGLIRIASYVVIHQGNAEDDVLTGNLKAWCKAKCSKHEYPHFIYYVDAIPKTPSGKLKRYLLVHQHQKELLHAN